MVRSPKSALLENPDKSPLPIARAEGQSLTEFSILFTIILIMLAGILDLGRVFYIYLALYSSSQEGATYVCSLPNCIDSSDCADPDNMEYRLRHENEVGLVDWSTVSISVTPSEPEARDLVTVDVSYNFPMVAPFVSAMAPSGLTLTGTSSCRVIGS